jgi:hypothetical protein
VVLSKPRRRSRRPWSRSFNQSGIDPPILHYATLGFPSSHVDLAWASFPQSRLAVSWQQYLHWLHILIWYRTITVRFQVHTGCLTLESYLPTRVNNNPVGINRSLGLSTHPVYCTHAMQIKSKSYQKPIYLVDKKSYQAITNREPQTTQLTKPGEKRKVGC